MNTPHQDIKEIRRLMEQSTRFISLSGLSGILVGIYALIGAWLTNSYYLPDDDITKIIMTALVVLVLSVITVTVLSARNARKQGVKVFSKPVRLLLINFAIPLATGGLFTIILLQKEYFDLLAASMLIFYGLSLLNASKYTADFTRNIGYLQIILGLIAAVFSGHSLLIWSIGFGWLHIIYSFIIYMKYER